MKIADLINEIKLYLENPIDSFDFANKIETIVFKHYDDFKKENYLIADLLDQEIPDICEKLEPNGDFLNFNIQIKNIYNKIIKIFNNNEN